MAVTATNDTGHFAQLGLAPGTYDVRAVKEYMTDLSNATRDLANQGECFDEAMRTLKLPKYESWSSYAQYLPGNIERFCEYWARGI